MLGYQVIADVQPCINWKDALSQYNTATILIYAPLAILRERDEERQAILRRPEQRRRYARAYVYETFFLLYGFDRTGDYIDHISASDLEYAIFTFPLQAHAKECLNRISLSDEPLPLYAKIHFDLLVRSDIENLLDNAALILNNLFIFFNLDGIHHRFTGNYFCGEHDNFAGD